MLVLSRKLGESVEIGDNKVIVRVLGIKRSKVQLGVDAPPEVAIHRSEKADRYERLDPDHHPRHTPSASSQNRIDSCADTRKSSLGNSAAPEVFDWRDGRGLALTLGESILEDLARVQAEIASLAELATTEQDRSAARQVAVEAVERLRGIERTVRFVRRQAAEQPIAAFVGSRSQTLKRSSCNVHADKALKENPSENNAQSWSERHDQSTTLIRESRAPFGLSASQCRLARS